MLFSANFCYTGISVLGTLEAYPSTQPSFLDTFVIRKVKVHVRKYTKCCSYIFTILILLISAFPGRRFI